MLIVWFMIQRQVAAEVTTIIAHNSPTISDVDDVNTFFNEEGYNSTRATFVKHMMSPLRKCFYGVKKITFCFLIPIYNCLSWILRELCILYDELMKIVS